MTLFTKYAQTKASKATNDTAKGKWILFETNPIKTGPAKKPNILKVFIVAKPAPFAIPGTLAALPYKIGAPHETPAPTIEKPKIEVMV